MKTMTMMWMVAALVACLSGCDCSSAPTCDPALPAGLEGGCCHSDGSCEEGFTCLEGACRACGASSLRCCYPDTTLGVCDPGLRCRPALPGSPEQCVPCGGLTQSCCSAPGISPCTEGLACAGMGSTATCQPAATVCRPGPTENVGIEDANLCGIRVLPVAGDTWAHRLECATSMLRPGERVRTSGPVTVVEPLPFSYCIERRSGGTVMRTPWSGWAFGDYEAGVCACGGEDMLIGCFRTPGACPAP
jgi:hypothetical protein